MICDKCGIEVVEVDNPSREEIRPKRGLENECIGGNGCPCKWFPRDERPTHLTGVGKPKRTPPRKPATKPAEREATGEVLDEHWKGRAEYEEERAEQTVGEVMEEMLGIHSSGIRRIAAERTRQIDHESYTDAHDDQHRDGQLAWAAATYIAPGEIFRHQAVGGHHKRHIFRDPWPESWAQRPTPPNEQPRLRQLEIAGALIAAEIDRLLRAEDQARREWITTIEGDEL